MKSNRISWGLVALVVLITIAISLAPTSSHSQLSNPKQQDTKASSDLTKYPVVNYDEPEPLNAIERDERRERNKRYDKKSFVIPNPRPDFLTSTIYDAEPVPPALPFNESKLVVIGEILGAKAAMSNDKSAVYSEYTVQIVSILRQVKGRDFQAGQHISVDRPGGRVHYPNGATILYMNDWQDLPESTGKYLFFLDAEEGKNPNFKILTAYLLKDGRVTALDHRPEFRKYNGREESEFLPLVR